MIERREEYLKEEYFKLQDQYEDYDARALQIKGWIGAGAFAGVALGLDTNAKEPALLWGTIIFITASFWYLEAKWKMFQYGIADRIRVIEAHFRGDKDCLIQDPDPLQIYNWWFSAYSKDKPIYEYERNFRPRSRLRRLFTAAFQTFVHLPYSLIIVACTILFCRS